MPNSSPRGKRIIHQWFSHQKDIESVVDVGCGQATYPKLLKDKKYSWIGIEIYEPYIKKYELNDYYNCILIGDIRTCELPEADCIIFGDILEHLEKYEAVKVLEKAEKIYRHIVVSIPVDYPQKAKGQNPHEEHKSVWTFKQLSRLFSRQYKIRKLDGNIAVFIK